MISKHQLISEVSRQIRHGQSKSVLYDLYKEDFEDEKLREILASFPSYLQRKKFRLKFRIISAIWIAFILLELISIVDLISNFNWPHLCSLLISGYLTLQIVSFNGKFFLSGIVWFGLTIIKLFYYLLVDTYNDGSYGYVFITAVVYCSILVAGMYLMVEIRQEVFSYYQWFQLKRDENNQVIFEMENPLG